MWIELAKSNTKWTRRPQIDGKTNVHMIKKKGKPSNIILMQLPIETHKKSSRWHWRHPISTFEHMHVGRFVIWYLLPLVRIGYDSFSVGAVITNREKYIANQGSFCNYKLEWRLLHIRGSITFINWQLLLVGAIKTY